MTDIARIRLVALFQDAFCLGQFFKDLRFDLYPFINISNISDFEINFYLQPLTSHNAVDSFESLNDGLCVNGFLYIARLFLIVLSVALRFFRLLLRIDALKSLIVLRLV